MPDREEEDAILFQAKTRRKRRIARHSRRFSFVFYEAIYGPLVFVKAVYRQLIILLAMFLAGAAVFANYDRLNPIDAFLASVSTITTIGLYVPHNGNFTQMSRSEAVLLILLIIISVGAGASILQNTVNTVVNGELTREATTKKLVSRLKDHVIVVGYSHLGRYVVEKLNEMEFDNVIITRDRSVYDEILAKDKLAVLEHDNRTMEVLKEAGIEKASLVIVAHSEDSDNMLFILAARKLRPDIRIVSVVHNDALIDAAKNAGADTVIPSSVTVGHLLALSAVTEDLVGVVFSEKIGTKEIAEFSVFKSSPLIGKGLQAVSEIAVLIGVIRNGEVIKDIFDPNFKIQENDTLLIFGDPAKLEVLEEEARAT